MITMLLRRFGLWPVVGAVTLLSIAVSIAITAAVHAFALGIAMPPAAWALAVVCPLVLAPSMSIGSFALLVRLDAAHEQLRRLSETDHLTGAHNRRYLMDRLQAESAALQGGGRPFALALLDVDNFKAVNDRYGHLAGDAVLCRLSDACRAQLGAGHTFARFGGEEFALLMPGATLDQAMALLEQLRHQVSVLVIDWSESPLTITVSIGVAAPAPSAPNAGAQMLAMLRLADEALYRAKREGKNRVAGPVHPRSAEGAPPQGGDTCRPAEPDLRCPLGS